MRKNITLLFSKFLVVFLLLFSFSIIFAQDRDGDGIVNSLDLDSDNDGILDIFEGLTSNIPDFSSLSTTTGVFGTNQTFDSNASCTTDYTSIMSTSYATTNTDANRPPFSPIGDTEGNFGFSIRGDQPAAYEELTLTFTQPVFLKIYNSNKVGPPNGTNYGAFDDNDEWTLITDGGGFRVVDGTALQSDLTVNSANQIKFQNGTAPNSTTFDVRTTVAVTSLVLRFRSNNVNTSDNYSPIRVEVLVPSDTDCDGTPNYLDLDSDNDGCFDAIEGADNVLINQLNADGSINIIANGGVATTPDVDDGVPNLVNVGGIADRDNAVGQGVGESQNALVNACYCYKEPIKNAGVEVPTKHGITALGRAGLNNTEWPAARQSAWTVLESKTKGLVVNRVDFDGAGNPVGIPSADFVEGMMVYDTVSNCLKIYDGSKWSCYSVRACPE